MTTSLTYKTLLEQLGPQPCRAAKLAQALQVTPAVLRKKIKPLVDENLVVCSVEGRATTYRLRTMQELVEAVEVRTAAERPLQVALNEPTAAVVQQALEFYSRIGLGQFEELLELARWGNLRGADGQPVSTERLQVAEGLVRSLKQTLLGMPSNASHSILSPRASESAKTAWAVSRALRHRMAWDRSPQGGMGVSFDEPIGSETAEWVRVTRGDGLGGIAIQKLPPSMLLQHRDGEYRVLGLTEDGDALRVHGESHSLQTVLQMAHNVATGQPARKWCA